MKTFYLMAGTNEIMEDNAIRREGNRIIYKDGGWNPASECYFTREQCRRHNKLPNDENAKLRKKLDKMIDQLESFKENL